eukprot:3289748-Pyramimonas_sp.AAC.1
MASAPGTDKSSNKFAEGTAHGKVRPSSLSSRAIFFVTSAMMKRKSASPNGVPGLVPLNVTAIR